MEFYSNCILESIKAKIRYGDTVRIVHMRSKDGLHHWGWVDKNNVLWDFHQTQEVKYWIQLLWFKGEIRQREWRIKSWQDTR